MLPSPTSSRRLVLENRTNLFHTPTHPKLVVSKLPTSSEDKKVKRRAAIFDDGPNKRQKLTFEDGGSGDFYDTDDSDVEMEDIAVSRARSRKLAPFQRSTLSAMRQLGNFRQPDSMYSQKAEALLAADTMSEIVSTRAILQSFVSSNKSDLYKCQSTDINAYLTPPYACSYTYGA